LATSSAFDNICPIKWILIQLYKLIVVFEEESAFYGI